MTTPSLTKAVPRPRTPAMDLGDYHAVLVVRTGEVDGHPYRRGTRPTVDSATLAKLRDAGLVDDDHTRPAADAAAGGPSGGH